MRIIDILQLFVLSASAIGVLLRLWAVIRKLAHLADVVEEIASSDDWPNGAKSLKQSHQDLYKQIVRVKAEMANNSERLQTVETHVTDIQRAIELYITTEGGRINGNN